MSKGVQQIELEVKLSSMKFEHFLFVGRFDDGGDEHGMVAIHKQGSLEMQAFLLATLEHTQREDMRKAFEINGKKE